MIEILVFFTLYLLNLSFSLFCWIWFLIGGIDRGIIFSSLDWRRIAACLTCCTASSYFWVLISNSSPF